MENGFNMWSFNGKLLYSMPRDRFQQLSWRPRVPSLLSKEKEEEIRKNLKEYSKWVGLGGCLGGGGWGAVMVIAWL
jgi:translation initiation factor 3 subunit B